MTHTAGGVPAPRPGGALAWLGRLTARHPWPVLVIAALFVVFAGLAGRDAASHLSSGGFTDPNAQSTKAGFVLARTFGVEDPSFVVLVTARHGTVDNPAATFAGRHLPRTRDLAAGIARLRDDPAALAAMRGAAARLGRPGAAADIAGLIAALVDGTTRAPEDDHSAPAPAQSW